MEFDGRQSLFANIKPMRQKPVNGRLAPPRGNHAFHIQDIKTRLSCQLASKQQTSRPTSECWSTCSLSSLITCVWSLAYSPSGERIASGGFKSICIWNTKTGKLVIGPIKFGLKGSVTSLVWSSDSTKLYSASDEFARVFDNKSGQLPSIVLSPKDNVLVCVGDNSFAQLWDTESGRPLGKSIHQNHDTLYQVSFSRDGKYVAYGGEDGKLTLCMVKDIAPQLPKPTVPHKNDGQSIREETQPNFPSLSLSCLDADATGGGDFIEEGHDDPSKFFQFSQQSLPLPSSGFHFPSLLSVRRFLSVISRRRQLPDQSIPQELSKGGLFSHARSNSSVELATTNPKPGPEAKVGEGEGEGENIDDVNAIPTLAYHYLNATAVSAVPHMIRSVPVIIKANSELIHPPTLRAHRCMIAPPQSTSIAKIIEHSGNG
ncbi:WD40-repeat-containing domain protein [Suillus fuscotomentosus]|uniref:WD40-repeat-containing domain protein n=1 Tax=Suillus fuscotomentosus TaxID=1912939 RepID=A0AAD4EAP5_9AGAM|nr:WD40-repeat-containing domain protein [Suillus fuscotomentosus]KAG1901458.1 WD40-repeat-containing domain protein [Suillus fuscotomentosus]